MSFSKNGPTDKPPCSCTPDWMPTYGNRLSLPCAVLNESSSKNQDRHSTFNADGVSAFGVYDGHGGTECAQALADSLLPSLLTNGFPEDAVVEDVFWGIDEDVGSAMAKVRCHAGSTCTVLLVKGRFEHKSTGESSSELPSGCASSRLIGMHAKLAWVGDSSGLVVDMQAQAETPPLLTPPHTPYTEAERTLLLRLADVHKVLRRLQGKKEDSFPVVTDLMRAQRKEAKLKKIAARRAADAKRLSSAEEFAMLLKLEMLLQPSSTAALTALEQADAVIEAATIEAAAIELVEAGEAGQQQCASAKGHRREKNEGRSSEVTVCGAKVAVEADSETEEEMHGSRAEAEAYEDASEVLVRQAIWDLGLETSDDVALYRRAFRRERIMHIALPRNAKYRRRCFIHRRAKEKDENEPLVVAIDDDPFSKHHKDLMMSRSIGDWTKCAWVLPHPQTLEFDVSAGEHKRVVLATDGLWDIMSHQEVMAVARDTPSVDEVAEILMSKARIEYLENRRLDKMGDDTTVMVIDLNPSNLAFEARRTCCVIL